MRVRRVLAVGAATVLASVGAAVGVGSPAGAATFGPLDHTLADGAANSLRDIVTNQATNAGGDEVDLQAGQTYTLTCAGGGALVHGNTPLTIIVPGTGNPATIQQTCPNTPILSHPGSTLLTLGNLNLTGGTALMSPRVRRPGPSPSGAGRRATSRPSTTSIYPSKTRSPPVCLGWSSATRHRPSRSSSTKTTPNSPSSAPAQALFAQAAAATTSGTVAQTGPSLIASGDTSNTVHVADVPAFNQVSSGQQLTPGPATILIGQDSSDALFVPPGCTDTDDSTSTIRFVSSEFQTTVTHSATFQFTGQLATPKFTG
jgi:hypothetical protein